MAVHKILVAAKSVEQAEALARRYGYSPVWSVPDLRLYVGLPDGESVWEVTVIGEQDGTEVGFPVRASREGRPASRRARLHSLSEVLMRRMRGAADDGHPE